MGGMSGEPPLLLFGASVRAAAFSALRAGLRPWCTDLFADTDLRACCPALALPAADYPEGFVEVCARAPEGPWMYTGGLENRPALVEKLCRLRPLWGNGADVLRQVRSPALVAQRLRRAGVACPEVRLNAAEVPKRGRWLVKPLDGVGGRGIAFVEDRVALSRRRHVYYQEYVEGEPCSAVYLGLERRLSDGTVAGAAFLEATRQLVGEPWLHAAPFHYCGSIGPLPLPLWRKFQRLGTVLAKAFGLRGLFGVDCVLRDGVPWVVEVNPRYSASVEVLEEPGGPSAVALHRAALEGTEVPLYWGSGEPQPYVRRKARGKAVLFAREPLVFPDDPFWAARAREFRPDHPGPPPFADIPPAGQNIEQGRPILTFFAEAATVDECQARLRATAADLDRRLFGR
jgi:predicted ATP-grasp superfamily ATP-dependent carboligase